MSQTISLVAGSGDSKQEIVLLEIDDSGIVKLLEHGVAKLAEPESKNNYRLQVLAAHLLLDAISIPTAEGEGCKDPGCNSGLEHRLRHLIALYTDLKANLEVAKQLATSEAIGTVRSKLVSILNGSGRTH